MGLAKVQNYGASANVYPLGFTLSTAFLAGMTAGPPSPCNLPRSAVSRYGAFYSSSAAILPAFPVRFGLRLGVVAYNLIAQVTAGAVNWPYGNGLT